MKKWILLSIIGVLLAGCASFEAAQRANTERLLSAAGFRIIPASTPERQKSLAALEPFTVIRKLKGDEVRYAYADPVQNFLYTGDQEAYAKYQELLLQQQIAYSNMSAARMNMNAAQQWNDWPCWGPAVIVPAARGHR